MHLNMLKGKIHRATVTHAEPDYEGSCAIDRKLLEASGIKEYEQIQIYNVSGGQRFTTYAIVADAGSGIVSVNGAAAHHAQPGDIVIICAYVGLNEDEAAAHQPTLVYADAENGVARIGHSIPAQAA